MAKPPRGTESRDGDHGRTVTIAERRARIPSQRVTGLRVIDTGQIYKFIDLVRSRAPVHWFIIGRDAGCDIRLADDTVTRTHCFIQWTGDKTLVRDHDSKNRTLINGVPLEDGRGQLLPGFVLELGNTELMACAEAETQPFILAKHKLTFAAKAKRYYPSIDKAVDGTGIKRSTLGRWVKLGKKFKVPAR